MLLLNLLKESAMLKGDYPEHDINIIFDHMNEVLSGGDCAENAPDELNFINRLFAALPAQAVEYGMQFLHGRRDLPSDCDEIMPLYIRFMNLLEYCETIEKMRVFPSSPTTEEINERIRMNSSLDEFEKPFCKPLLGFAFNKEEQKTEAVKEEPDQKKKGSGLHLLNGAAQILVCEDPLKTSLFYENRLGFEAVHLDDESLPHIRLSRDNTELILVKSPDGMKTPINRELYKIPYDLYLYVSEPMLLQSELQNAKVRIIKELTDAGIKSDTNREFIFEDIDGRHICVSQRNALD